MAHADSFEGGPFQLAPLFLLLPGDLTEFGAEFGSTGLYKLNEIVKHMRVLLASFGKNPQNSVIMYFSVTAVQHVLHHCHWATGVPSYVFVTCVNAYHDLGSFYSHSKGGWFGLDADLLHAAIPPPQPLPDLDVSAKKVLSSRLLFPVLPAERARFFGGKDLLTHAGGLLSVGGSLSDLSGYESSIEGGDDDPDDGGWVVTGPPLGERGKRLEVRACAAGPVASSDVSELSVAGVSGAAMSLGTDRHVHWGELPETTGRLSPTSATWRSPSGPEAFSEDEFEMSYFTWGAGATPRALSPITWPGSGPDVPDLDFLEVLADLENADGSDLDGAPTKKVP